MSKTVLEKDLTISDRLIKVLTDKGLVKANGSVNFSAAERKAGLKGTVLQKAVKRDGGLYDDNLDKFLRTFHVKREWLLRGEGDVYEKNPTSASNSTDNMESGSLEIKDADKDYFYVPKTLVQGEYRLELISQIESRERLMQKALDVQDALIKQLKVEIEDLRSRLHVVPANRA
jgi:hypothetical protein